MRERRKYHLDIYIAGLLLTTRRTISWPQWMDSLALAPNCEGRNAGESKENKRPQ